MRAVCKSSRRRRHSALNAVHLRSAARARLRARAAGKCAVAMAVIVCQAIWAPKKDEKERQRERERERNTHTNKCQRTIKRLVPALPKDKNTDAPVVVCARATDESAFVPPLQRVAPAIHAPPRNVASLAPTLPSAHAHDAACDTRQRRLRPRRRRRGAHRPRATSAYTGRASDAC